MWLFWWLIYMKIKVEKHLSLRKDSASLETLFGVSEWVHWLSKELEVITFISICLCLHDDVIHEMQGNVTIKGEEVG